MYELWLLFLYYRILKAIVQFISRHWVLIVFAFFLGILAGIAAGSFFIALYALLRHREQPYIFNTNIFISLGLCIFGLYCLTTDFYKEFPTMYKVTAIGNVLGLLLTAAYFIRFALSRSGNSHSLPQPLIIGFIVASIALLTYNHFANVSDYLLASGKQFHVLLKDEKRAKYRSDFEAFIQSHPRISKGDYHCYEVWKQKHVKLTYTGSAGDDTLIIASTTHQFQVVYYTYTRQEGYEELATIPLLNGFDADYNNGNIIYLDNFHFQYLDSIHIAYARESGKQLHTSIEIKVDVLPRNIDSYVAYREGNALGGMEDMYVAKEYLESKGIPIIMDKL